MRSFGRWFLVLATVLMVSSAARAASYTWTGAVSTVWSEPGNWSPPGPPGSGDDLSFPAAPANATLTNDLPPGTAVRWIGFYGGPYVINGNALGVSAAISAPQLSWQSVTFNTALTFAQSLSGEVRLDGSLILNGAVDLQAQLIDIVDAQIAIHGDVSGSSPIMIAHASGLQLYGNDSCTGTLNMQSSGMLALMGSHLAGRIVASRGTVIGTGAVGSFTLVGGILNPGGLGPDRYGSPVTFPGRLTVTDLTLVSGSIQLDVFGPDPGVSYDQIKVLGHVQLGGNIWNLRGNWPYVTNPYVPAPGTVFTFIDNNSTDPMAGTFNGLQEGAIYLASGLSYGAYTSCRVSYKGGDGNDVAMTVVTFGNYTQTVLHLSNIPRFLGAGTLAAGKPLGLMAQVTCLFEVPTGSVTFLSDGIPLGTTSVVPDTPTQTYRASLSTSSLSIGKHEIMAEFGGDARCTASMSGPYEGSSGLFDVTVVSVPTVRGDLDGDGRADVVWSNASTTDTAVWFMAGVSPPVGQALSLGSGVNAPSIQGWKIVGIADFNGDGYSDVLSEAPTGMLNISYMKGSSSFASAGASMPIPNDNVSVLALDDFDGNGPIGVRLWYGRNSSGWTLPIDSFYGYTFPKSALGFGGDWRVAGSGDIDGDGKAELVWRNDTTGETVWTNSTTAVTGPSEPSGWQLVAVADFDGDGRPDFFWRNRITGDNAIWIMSGGQIIASATMPSVPDPAWQVATFGDYDGDGKSDLFWRNTVTGDNSIWLMNGTAAPLGVAMPQVPNTAWMPVRP